MIKYKDQKSDDFIKINNTNNETNQSKEKININFNYNELNQEFHFEINSNKNLDKNNSTENKDSNKKLIQEVVLMENRELSNNIDLQEVIENKDSC